MDELSDRIRKGDREAFDRLCRERYASLISYASIFLDVTSAEDVVQDVLFALWQKREGLREGADVQPWLISCVHNRCLNILERRKSRRSFENWYRERIDSLLARHLAPDANPVMTRFYNNELGRSLEEAISQLPPRCAEIFRLSYIEKLSGKEISERLGISLSTVENQINIALKRLRLALQSQM